MLKSLFRSVAWAHTHSARFLKPLPYAREFKGLEDSDFQDRSYCKTFLKKNIKGRSERSQKGLFHGKESRAGKQYCFSDKRHIRRFRVNAHYKTFYSHILETPLEILCSQTAVRTIRKYGGIDNYILLTRERNMKSMYGEYLREMMTRKLTDPGFNVTEVLRNPIYKVKFKKKGARAVKYKKHWDKFIWQPPEIRHIDMSMHRELPEDEIPLRDRKEVGST